MTTIEQCRFCEHLNPKDKSFYGESFRCTKNHKFVDPLSRCNEYKTKAVICKRRCENVICPVCKAKLHSYDSRQRGDVRKRSYKCPACETKVYTTEKIDYVKRSVP